MDYSIFRGRFGRKIHTLRKEKNITQERLAELVDKSTEHISFIERGERSPSFELLIDLSLALSVPLPNLMNIMQQEEERNDQTNLLQDILPAPVSLISISDQIEDPIKPEEQRKRDFIIVLEI